MLVYIVATFNCLYYFCSNKSFLVLLFFFIIFYLLLILVNFSFIILFWINVNNIKISQKEEGRIDVFLRPNNDTGSLITLSNLRGSTRIKIHMYWWYEDRSFGDELFSFFLFEIFNSADVCFCLRLRCCSTFFVAEVHVFDGVLKMYFAALKVILTNQVINSLDNDFYKRIEYKEDWWLLHILVMPLNMFHLVIESTI